MADEGPLRRHLLPQCGDLFRRGDAGARVEPVHAADEPRRDPLHRPFRAGHGAGRGPAAPRRPDHLSHGRRGMSRPVTVLVVDDSPTMRGLISAALRRDPEIEVVGTAADPLEAREAIKRLNPDVITLDVEMPNMNGLEFLEKIMRLRPMPVVMVSTLTQAGADVTVAALAMGAVDAVGKPVDGTPAAVAFAELAQKVKDAANSRVPARGDAPAAP